MKAHARGTFEVKLDPQPPYDTAEGISLAHTALSKTFHGDLEGRSTMEMLSAVTPVQGSAGYVGIERVTGVLQGRAGSFVLQHAGTMTRGQAALNIAVVPDSGAGALAGLSGRLTIEIVDGQHFYAFDYTLEPAS